MRTRGSQRLYSLNLIGTAFVIAAVVIAGCTGRGHGDGGAHRVKLIEVPNFGSNPGDLAMFKYAPASHPSNAPLVVAMHGCAQDAQNFADHSGWPQLADRMGFMLVFPQQRRRNNAAMCFNWFEPHDSMRNSGEAQSIKQMVDKMKSDYSIDTHRVYVTGLSAGGAMAGVMLATYPDVFAGGAIMSGIPYGCARSLSATFSCMNSSVEKTPRQWGDLVRAAGPGAASWPIVSIWQGTADHIVAPVNAHEEMMQWTNVHGVPPSSSSTDTVAGFPHQVFKDKTGKPVVEVYSITGMGHGQAVDPGDGSRNCGSAARFFPNEHICSAYYALKFWGVAR